MTPGPPPHAVRYNDWPGVAVPLGGPSEPAPGVTVVLSCPRSANSLACAFAALGRQSHPTDRVEVIVAGAAAHGLRWRERPPPLDIKWIDEHTDGAAAARNQGARAARHDIVVFLDADAIADSRLLAAHAAWHRTVSDAVTVGLVAPTRTTLTAASIRRCRGESLRGLFEHLANDPPWPAPEMGRTDALTAPRDDLFRALAGGNFGMRKAFYEELGGSAESFDRYGGAGVELAYRAFNSGALLVPVREALAWRPACGNGRRRRGPGTSMRAAQLANLIPHPAYRSAATGRIYARPRHAITIQADANHPERAAASVETLLAGPVRDLAIRVQITPCNDAAVALLCAQFAADPRVSIDPGQSALEQFPATPLHVEIPAGAAPGSDLLSRLDAALGTAAMARLVQDDGSVLTVTRAWAMHRARRTGRPATDFGDLAVVEAPLPPTGRAATNAHRPSMPGRRVPVVGMRRVLAELRHVRGVRTGWRFGRWLIASFTWTGGRSARAQVRATPSARGATVLGVRLAALGERAEAVLRTSARVANRPDPGTELLLVDTAQDAGAFSGPSVALDDAPDRLSVPAFDPLHWNPVGWVRNVEPGTASLGPRRHLPAEAKVRREIHPEDRTALRYCHHVEDVQAYHADAIARAGTLVRLAATGTPVHLADGGPGLAKYIGAELHRLMTADMGGDDIARRERISIRMRRIAMREHSLPSRVRQIAAAGGLVDAPHPPLVSILLPTRRPEYLSSALANVAKQNYPRLELVLALHGDGFDKVPATDRLPHPVKVLRVAARASLGTVLNLAANAASGTLLAKMDDDDLYGPNHIWDLALAHQYSAAEVVGKGLQTVYLAGRDRTVQYALDNSETYESWHLGGGALLISRHDLERVGGWRRVALGEDRLLLRDVRRSGGRVYRTHGAEYVAVRHGKGHAWDLADQGFVARAEVVRRGFCPTLADIDTLDPPFARDRPRPARSPGEHVPTRGAP